MMRVLKDFLLAEISVVDRPAVAPALALIAKRAVAGAVQLATSAVEGHAHGVAFVEADGAGMVRALLLPAQAPLRTQAAGPCARHHGRRKRRLACVGKRRPYACN